MDKSESTGRGNAPGHFNSVNPIMVIDIFILVLGLAVGSFLNVAIHRLPHDQSVITPSSRCPKCEGPIAWYDNIPVLSFLILARRCRHCREKISIRYPAVELVSALIWYESWRTSGGSVAFLIPVLFISLLLVATVTDLETGLIPDEVTLGGIIAGLLASYFWPALHETTLGYVAIGRSALGFFTGGALIYVTGLAGNWIFQRELAKLGMNQSMGGGDVKLLAMAGSFLGWEKVLLGFFTAPLLGLPFALYTRLAKNNRIIPYGPFLSIACLIQFLFGNVLWQWFMRI